MERLDGAPEHEPQVRVRRCARGARVEPLAQRVHALVAGLGATQQIAEHRVRDPAVELVGAPGQARSAGAGQQLRREARLADARLAAHEHAAGPARVDASKLLKRRGQKRFAAD